MAEQDWSVEIEHQGRFGYLVYKEKSNTMKFYWELAFSDNYVASISIPTQAEWAKYFPCSEDHRKEITDRVVKEAIRQKAPNCVPEVDKKYNYIHLKKL